MSFFIWRKKGASLLGKKITLIFLELYRRGISPFRSSSCRFYPSCSAYAKEAITVYGVQRGIWLTMKRLLRCHPFHRGGFDPVKI